MHNMDKIDCHDSIFPGKTNRTENRFKPRKMRCYSISPMVRPIGCRRTHQKIRTKSVFRRKRVRNPCATQLHRKHTQDGRSEIYRNPSQTFLSLCHHKNLRISACLRNAVQNLLALCCVLERTYLKHLHPPSVPKILPQLSAVLLLLG